mmetsp:Transcript_24511/g.45845  ORF Transcript_24511/g.45845 Transcript_24511/m.45845 type:complete len:208 (-) Transcript_24511:15-638(-)
MRGALSLLRCVHHRSGGAHEAVNGGDEAVGVEHLEAQVHEHLDIHGGEIIERVTTVLAEEPPVLSKRDMIQKGLDLVVVDDANARLHRVREGRGLAGQNGLAANEVGRDATHRSHEVSSSSNSGKSSLPNHGCRSRRCSGEGSTAKRHLGHQFIGRIRGRDSSIQLNPLCGRAADHLYIHLPLLNRSLFNIFHIAHDFPSGSPALHR